jgi:long-chain acyl-CoA synthetase
MTDGQDSMARLDTLPKILLDHAAKRPDGPALREKDLGIWLTWSWSKLAEQSRALACGLASHGFERGDKVAIIGDNRPELYMSMSAIQSLGGVPVPFYQDSVAEEMQYVMEHSEVRFAIVEDQEQTDKVLSIRDRCPKLDGIIYKDPRGMRHYKQPGVFSLTEMQERGRTFNADNTDFFTDEVGKGTGSDIAVMLYTSGTTGRPKGVMLSYDNVVITARNANARERFTDKDEVIAYLPMAWVGDHMISYGQAMVSGYTVNCPESSETVMIDLRELGPTSFFAPPRVFEGIITQVMVRMEDASWLKRKIFHYFLDVAKNVGVRLLEGKPVTMLERLQYGLGKFLVYGPLCDSLGFSNIRIAYTGGEAIGPEIFEFFRSIGVNLKILFGQTEASVYVTLQPDDEVWSDSVGVAAPETEIRFDEETGELLYRSPGVFVGYYKNDEATRETKTEDGWVHTGDAGYVDERGHIRIIDRAKDVGKLNDGTMFAPKFLENKLKFYPDIREAVCFGDGKDFTTAFINIDLESVGNWAERNNINYGSYVDLANRDEVYDIVKGHIEATNRSLAEDPNLVGAQIKRFMILHKLLDADDGELTRTGKVRRSTVFERYDNLIQALYSDQELISVEAKVTFENGKEGVIKADLKIRDVETYAALQKAG